MSSQILRATILSLGLFGFGTAIGAERLTVDVPTEAKGATLRLVKPDGSTSEFPYASAAAAATIDPQSLLGEAAADGTYRYEIRFARMLDEAQAESLRAQRRDGVTIAPADQPAELASVNGSFAVASGQVLPLGSMETPSRPKQGEVPNDQVIADDLIVQGSICAGFDCVNNEDFGFDTLRLKENNTRIKFEDTSVGAFAADDWQLTANESASGGLNKFSIENVSAATVPFTVVGAAPSNSLYIAPDGNVGLRTSTPVLDLHLSTTDTPAMRLEQTDAGGFTAQTWDVAGNEANFFIRDVTGGSRLSFRIRPGAPTSSIDIAANGDVGIGTASPQARLHVAGDAYVAGTLTQLSSRTSKTNFVAVATDSVLDQLASLPIWTWNYLRSDIADRHIGPVAEDFYAAFGFGTSDRQLAPADVAGVALAATQALQREVAERDRTITALEIRLARLEAMLLIRESDAGSSTSGH